MGNGASRQPSETRPRKEIISSCGPGRVWMVHVSRISWTGLGTITGPTEGINCGEFQTSESRG